MLHIECSGSPREMGRQYGEAAREGMARNYAWRKVRERAAEAPGFTATARALLVERLPEVWEELEGVVEGSGMPWDAVLYDNFTDTFGDSWAAERCTPVALSRGPEGAIVGKNNDGPPPEVDSLVFVTRTTRPTHGLPVIQVTYAGWLSGLDAINAEGLANTHGSVGSTLDKAGRRIDIRLQALALMRRCRTARAFTAGLMDASLTGKGFNIIAMDRNGDGRILEAAVPLVAERPSSGNFLYSTNHYTTEALSSHDARDPAKKWISVYRYGYLRWVEATAAPVDLAGMQRLLACHEPWAPCRHGGPHGSVTIWSHLCLCREAAMLVADGHPCSQSYVRLSL